jgi:hypothetical protein
MIITYHGVECFKIAQGELSLVINPNSKMSTDVTVFTDKHGDTSDKSGFVIDGPGEYEVKGVFVKGFSDHTFLVTFEGIKLCFLGLEANREEIEGVDILFVRPNAYKTAVTLEPAVMIPMNYDKNTLAQFLKEAGEKNGGALDKLVVKKKDLEGKEGEIIVLKEE